MQRLLLFQLAVLVSSHHVPMHVEAAPPAPLPKVILIGDSIREGYAPHVIKRCAGVVEVVSSEKFGQNSKEVLEHLELVIAAKPNIVHLNSGLRDLARSKETGRPTISLEEYETNLKAIVNRLRKETSAKLIFATVTPVIDSRHAQRRFEFNRTDADVNRYNSAALKIAKDADIEINDLYGAVSKRGPDGLISADGVHFSPSGYGALGDVVARSILKEVQGTSQSK